MDNNAGNWNAAQGRNGSGQMAGPSGSGRNGGGANNAGGGAPGASGVPLIPGGGKVR